jgi:hypothetical protein
MVRDWRCWYSYGRGKKLNKYFFVVKSTILKKNLFNLNFLWT